MIIREISKHFKRLFEQYPVVTITGPRQSGKTTLARSTFPDLPYKNLEHPETRLFAKEDPIAFLKTVPHGAIIDEIQYVPELSSYLQVIVDEDGQNGMFVLTGSQQFNMLQTVSQSLAGRSAILKLLPFSYYEIAGEFEGIKSADDYIFRGFYPRLYDQNIDPSVGLPSYIETYIERDLRQLSQVHDLMLFQKFMRLCAGALFENLVITEILKTSFNNVKTNNLFLIVMPKAMRWIFFMLLRKIWFSHIRFDSY